MKRVLRHRLFWPIVAPLTALLVEPSPGRRRMMAVCLAIGVAVGVYFLWSIVTYVPTASVGHGHIVYEGEPESPLALKIGYFAAVSMGAALSSFRTLRLFALIVFAGSLISYLFYWEAFSSVWCFFAAAASAVIVLHFEQVRQLRRRLPGVKIGVAQWSNPDTPASDTALAPRDRQADYAAQGMEDLFAQAFGKVF